MGRRTFLRALAAISMIVLGACGGGGDGVALADGDGGFEATEGPEDVDAGQDFREADCDALVARTCGTGDAACIEQASCQAARLIRDYEPHRCADALGDTFTFPPCEADACTKLVEKTCGSAQTPVEACADRGGCPTAQDLSATARDDAAAAEDRQDALEACATGLEDEVLFPSCY